ncbi:MAG: sigma-70 family RNA polymerase sigma factor [Acidobacteria bacterium]|nr:sigma-70 family RNA polymerase sigma factor [Acidobacteriota bacterium]
MAGASQEAARESGSATDAEPRTFLTALRAHQAMVFSLAYHFLRDRNAAEEVAQDVFLELHRHWDELGSDDHVKFWLRRVASNRCIDRARRRKYQPIVALDDVPEPSTPGEPSDFLLNQKLRDLVSALPEKPRMVMVLRYQEEMMPEQIATLLGMPVSTVKSHLQRSLAMLREKAVRSLGEVR